MKNISLFIIAKNEADKLAKCIISAKLIADEIIVVDSHSTDDTAKIAEGLGAKVYQRSFTGFADQKNYALSKCTGKWALSLDADEIVTPKLSADIRLIDEDTPHCGFAIKRENYFIGGRMKHGGFENDFPVRLVKVGKARYGDALVHESLKVDGTVSRLDNPMEHYSYNDLETYFVKFNNYTSLAAREMFEKKRRFSLAGTILRLPAEFLKRYVLKLGFLDGIRGLIWASISTFYVFVKYIKLWHLIDSKGASV